MNNNFKQKPVIFLTFANDNVDGLAYLRNLPKERRKIWDVLDGASKEGLCEVIVKPDVTIKDIFDVFQDDRYRNRIAIFHYGGHANCYQLLLESHEGRHAAAHREGLVSFLARQEGLKFIFLNGCSSEQHALELIQAGIPAVVGTSQYIDDNVATKLSIRFYNGIAKGFPIERAWHDAVDDIKTQRGIYNFRDLYWQGRKDKEDRFPWDIFFKEGAEEVKEWNLPEAANNPLFGLPKIPKKYGLPECPFLFLKHYEKEHVNIFFGRSSYIRNIYNRITDPKSPAIILLCGQSGVGKSSLLYAGLMPRLECSHIVIYTRRIQKKGLLGTLLKALQGHPLLTKEGTAVKNSTVLEKWQRIESESKKKLVIILDQAEEMYTHPNKELQKEFDDFLFALKEIFGNHALCPKGKLILSYRKEYDPEFKKKIRSYELPRSWLFLEPLSRKDIMEVVTGLTKTSALRQRYNNIKIEEDLPVIIADNLLEDKNSPIAPVLQIILTKMWNSTLDEESPNARFTVEGYRRLRKQGIAMEDFFNQQMAKMRAWNTDVVDSGLALDLLNFHTSKLGTSCSRNIKDIRQSYQHRQYIIDGLVQKLKDHYLLTTAPNCKEETVLTHDTLAPIVIKEYNDSDKPGQRAARILSVKIKEFKREEKKKYIWLDEVDLEIVEQGKKGKRTLDKDEEKLLEISRKRKLELEETRIQQIRKIEANRLAAISQRKVEEAPTIALRLAEKAYQLDKNKTVIETIYKIYWENNFYKIIAKQKDSIYCVAFSPDDKYILTGSGNSKARLWDLQGKELQVFKGHKEIVKSVAFSPDGKYILTGSWDSTARLWDLNGKKLHIFKGHENKVMAVAFSPDGKYILTGSEDKTARLWNLQGKELQDFKGHKEIVTAVAFSPDGKYILTGSWDKTARLWEVKMTWEEFLKKGVFEELNEEQKREYGIKD